MVDISSYFEFYAFTDPASAKTTGRSQVRKARQSIVVCGVDSIMRFFVVYAWAGALATSLYIDKLLRVHERFHPRLFGVEANAMQSLFADCVRDKAKERKIKSIKFLGIHQPTNIDKDFRIRTALEPVINEGRLFLLSERCDVLLHGANVRLRVPIDLEVELQGFPTAMFKDLVDCLASVVRLIPPRPKRKRHNEEMEQTLSYLRNTGAPAWYIEQYAAQFGETLGSGRAEDDSLGEFDKRVVDAGGLLARFDYSAFGRTGRET